MRSTLRSVLAALTLTAVLGLSAACSLAIPEDASAGQPSASAEQKRVDALNKYVQLERSKIPQVEELFPGIYESFEINGEIKALGASDGVTPGDYAVVTYHYVFAVENDWEESIPLFEAQLEEFDKVCQSDVFAIMTRNGVTGLKVATWTYTDVANTPTIMWSHSCYSE